MVPPGRSEKGSEMADRQDVEPERPDRRKPWTPPTFEVVDVEDTEFGPSPVFPDGMVLDFS
jgi:hypothetical protein